MRRLRAAGGRARGGAARDRSLAAGHAHVRRLRRCNDCFNGFTELHDRLESLVALQSPIRHQALALQRQLRMIVATE